LPLQISETPIKVLVHHDGRGQHGDAHFGKARYHIAEAVGWFGHRGLIQLPSDSFDTIEQAIDASAGPLSGQIDDGNHAADLQKPRRRLKALAVAGAVPNRPRKTLVI
jgi:hypothetical protein